MGIEDVCKTVFEREVRGEPCRYAWVPGKDGARRFNWIAYREACRHLCPDRQIKVGTAFVFYSGDCYFVDVDGRLSASPYQEEWSAPDLFMTDEEFVEAVTEAQA